MSAAAADVVGVIGFPIAAVNTTSVTPPASVARDALQQWAVEYNEGNRLPMEVVEVCVGMGMAAVGPSGPYFYAVPFGSRAPLRAKCFGAPPSVSAVITFSDGTAVDR